MSIWSAVFSAIFGDGMVESPDGTTITKPTDPAIIDLLAEKWTLAKTNGGQCVVNGVTDGSTGNVTKIIYVGHLVYHMNKAGDYYVKAQASAPNWKSSGAPPTITPPVVIVLPSPTHATVQAQLDAVMVTITSIRTNVGKLIP